MADTEKKLVGDLSVFSIVDIIQSLMMGRRTALLSLQSGEKKGALHVETGQIVYAVDHQLRQGNRAAVEVLNWTEGVFIVDFEAPSVKHNVSSPTEHLLLEIARNTDEARKDLDEKTSTPEAPSQATVSKDVGDRFDAQLKSQVNAIFKRVASTSAPQRSRYSLDAFDSLLQALVELSGTVLFLKPGQRPRVRTSEGFAVIKEEAIERAEIEGFLRSLLSETEAVLLREAKEVSTFFQSKTAGPFRVVAVDEQGSVVLTLTPCGRPVPPIEQAVSNPEAVQDLTAPREGLVVVAGPLGSGKSLLSDAIVSHHMASRGAFAYQFSRGSAYSITTDRGMSVRRAIPPTAAQFHDALRAALEQAPEIISIAGASDREALSMALSACGGGRLVLFALESHSPGDTACRLLHLARTGFGESLLDPLSERLRLIADLTPSPRSGPPRVSVLRIEPAIRSMIAAGDERALKSARISEMART